MFGLPTLFIMTLLGSLFTNSETSACSGLFERTASQDRINAEIEEELGAVLRPSVRRIVDRAKEVRKSHDRDFWKEGDFQELDPNSEAARAVSPYALWADMARSHGEEPGKAVHAADRTVHIQNYLNSGADVSPPSRNKAVEAAISLLSKAVNLTLGKRVSQRDVHETEIAQEMANLLGGSASINQVLSRRRAKGIESLTEFLQAFLNYRSLYVELAQSVEGTVYHRSPSFRESELFELMILAEWAEIEYQRLDAYSRRVESTHVPVPESSGSQNMSDVRLKLRKIGGLRRQLRESVYASITPTLEARLRYELELGDAEDFLRKDFDIARRWLMLARYKRELDDRFVEWDVQFERLRALDDQYMEGRMRGFQGAADLNTLRTFQDLLLANLELLSGTPENPGILKIQEDSPLKDRSSTPWKLYRAARELGDAWGKDFYGLRDRLKDELELASRKELLARIGVKLLVKFLNPKTLAKNTVSGGQWLLERMAPAADPKALKLLRANLKLLSDYIEDNYADGAKKPDATKLRNALQFLHNYRMTRHSKLGKAESLVPLEVQAEISGWRGMILADALQKGTLEVDGKVLRDQLVLNWILKTRNRRNRTAIGSMDLLLQSLIQGSGVAGTAWGFWEIFGN